MNERLCNKITAVVKLNKKVWCGIAMLEDVFVSVVWDYNLSVCFELLIIVLIYNNDSYHYCYRGNVLMPL